MSAVVRVKYKNTSLKWPQISASCKANVAPISKQQFIRPSLWWYVASRRRHDHMVVGFTTTCVISVYHHWSCEFEPRSLQGVLYTTLCDKVCQWLATGRWFSPGTPVSSTNKTDRHDITEILLKVALNTTTLTPSYILLYRYTSKNVLCYLLISRYNIVIKKYIEFNIQDNTF